MHPEKESLIAIITYCLSAAGRRASRKADLSAAYHQNVYGTIAPSDRHLFHQSPEGTLSAVFNQMEFDARQSFESVLDLLRQRKTRLGTIKTLIEAEVIADAVFKKGA